MKWLDALIAAFFAWYKPIPEPPTPEPMPEPIPTPPEPPKSPPTLSLAYEAKPYIITQPWGVYDPKTYSKYGYTRHSGVDIAHGINARLRAPFDCEIIGTQYQAGGGRVLSILSEKEYLTPEGDHALVRVDYLHLKSYVQTEGHWKKGTLLCIAGNTGETTGPHTHIKYTWVKRSGTKLIEIYKNDADNSFDPTPFYDGTFAVDSL